MSIRGFILSMALAVAVLAGFMVGFLLFLRP